MDKHRRSQMRIMRSQIRCAKVRNHHLKARAFIAALAIVTGGAAAAEVAWPKNSVTEFSVFVALQRFQIYTTHCSGAAPQLQVEFASAMQDLERRMRAVSKGVLAAGTFSDLKNRPVPSEIVFAFHDIYEDMEHNFERRDPASSCPDALQSLRTQDEDSLKTGLVSTLVAVRNMIRNLEKASVP